MTAISKVLICVFAGALVAGCNSAPYRSGKGNDQYRMHNVFSIFAPELKILVPVRDFDLTRTEELAHAEITGT